VTGERRSILLPVIFLLALLVSTGARGEPVPVRHPEGTVHGFLALRTLDGKTIAVGSLVQTLSPKSQHVTSRVAFRFPDGSRYEETAVFSQSTQFRLVSHHALREGPSFEESMDMSIDVGSGQVRIRSTDGHGEQKEISEKMELPADLANGMLPVLVKNGGSPAFTVSLVAATPQPRLVKLHFEPVGEQAFTIAGTQQTATRYRVNVDLGGIVGVLAPLLGKQPADTYMWVVGGEAPAFVRAEGPLFAGGPEWRIELVSPDFTPSTEARP
jgi:hypothetical protein